MKQQTAVDWLETKLGTSVKLTPPEWEMFYDLISQAKQMEKEQIVDAYNQSDLDGLSARTFPDYAEQYYNKTYQKDKL